MNLSIDANQYPGISFKVNGSQKSSIFDYGTSLTLRQYNDNGTYTEIGIPTLLNMKSNVSLNTTNISNNTTDINSLKEKIGKTMLYKGYVTDGLLHTVDTGIFLYDSANSINIPVSAGTGVIFSFNLETTLCYRLCITSSSGVYYSVYIAGSTYGTWKHLSID